MTTDNNNKNEEKIRKDLVKSQALYYLYQMLNGIKGVTMEEFIKLYVDNKLSDYVKENILVLFAACD
jgi:hypothetical protein